MPLTGGRAKAPRTGATVSGKTEEKVANQQDSATPTCVQYYEGPVLGRFSDWDLDMEIGWEVFVVPFLTKQGTFWRPERKAVLVTVPELMERCRMEMVFRTNKVNTGSRPSVTHAVS